VRPRRRTGGAGAVSGPAGGRCYRSTGTSTRLPYSVQEPSLLGARLHARATADGRDQALADALALAELELSDSAQGAHAEDVEGAPLAPAARGSLPGTVGR
jgi:hypothetical protein